MCFHSIFLTGWWQAAAVFMSLGEHLPSSSKISPLMFFDRIQSFVIYWCHCSLGEKSTESWIIDYACRTFHSAWFSVNKFHIIRDEFKLQHFTCVFWVALSGEECLGWVFSWGSLGKWDPSVCGSQLWGTHSGNTSDFEKAPQNSQGESITWCFVGFLQLQLWHPPSGPSPAGHFHPSHDLLMLSTWGIRKEASWPGY